MSNTPDATACVGTNGLLPVDPFRSLRVHFGMLLGVDDFATLDAYHRGKMWLHNAWLHGAGAVWGLEVSPDLDHGEIRVAPGLAIDALGRELHLDADSCVNVARWFEQHHDDAGLNAETADDGSVTFDAHVVIRFRKCLMRPVPALSEPCEQTGNATAYSRIFETVELLLLPGPAPAPSPPGPYHRLRLLFRLEDPTVDEDGAVIEADQDVINRREGILAEAAEDQPELYLEAFREFAALDELEFRPASSAESDERSLFPAIDPAPLVLAELNGLTLSAVEGGTLTAAKVDNTVRQTLLATATIQELLCGPLFRVPVSPGEEPSPPPGPPPDPAERDTSDTGADAGGPRINADSVKPRNNRSLRFSVEGSPPLVNSIKGATSVSVFETDKGWRDFHVRDTTSAEGTVTIELEHEFPSDSLVRLIVRGTGPSPLIGRNRVPLAGAVGGPPGSEHDGNDFVHMIRLSE